MNILKSYFSSQNKYLLFLPIILFATAFYIQYRLVMDYQTELYRLHSEAVKESRLNDEITIFKVNLLGYSILYILQVIGTCMAINIGFIFFGYKFSFKGLGAIILKSTIALIGIYFVVPFALYIAQKVY